MENRVVTTRNINIQLNNARKRSRKTFYELKEKNETSVPTEIEPPTIENCEKEGSIRQWKKSTTLIVGDSMLAGIEEVGVYPETGVKSSNLSLRNSPRYVRLFETLAKNEFMQSYK